jgi:hypothetical protein
VSTAENTALELLVQPGPLSELNQFIVAEARTALGRLVVEQRVEVLVKASAVSRAARRGSRAARVSSCGEPVEKPKRVVNQRDCVSLDKLVELLAVLSLELPAERAQEVDVGIDRNRAAANDDAVAVGRRTGGGWGDEFRRRDVWLLGTGSPLPRSLSAGPVSSQISCG